MANSNKDIITRRALASQALEQAGRNFLGSGTTRWAIFEITAKDFTISSHFFCMMEKMHLTSRAAVKYTIIAFAWNNEPYTDAAPINVQETQKPFIIRSV